MAGLVFVISIRQSNTPIVISNVGKCQHITFIGWELFLKFPHPDFHSPVGTDFTESVKKFQVFLCDFKSDINLYILVFFLFKISFCNLVLPAYCAERAENCCFSHVSFFPTSIKAVFYITDFKTANVSEVFNVKFLDTHKIPSRFLQNCTSFYKNQRLF